MEPVKPITEQEFGTLLNRLNDEKKHCGLLKISKGYANHHVPEELRIPLPAHPLSSWLFKPEMVGINFNILLEEAEKSFPNIQVSEVQAVRIELLTREQSKSKNDLWNSFRQGRLTASNIYSVVKTSLENPAKSVVQKVCYPMNNKFFSAPTRLVYRNTIAQIDYSSTQLLLMK